MIALLMLPISDKPKITYRPHPFTLFIGGAISVGWLVVGEWFFLPVALAYARNPDLGPHDVVVSRIIASGIFLAFLYVLRSMTLSITIDEQAVRSRYAMSRDIIIPLEDIDAADIIVSAVRKGARHLEIETRKGRHYRIGNDMFFNRLEKIQACIMSRAPRTGHVAVPAHQSASSTVL